MEPSAPGPEKKKSKIAGLFEKVDLDFGTFLMMMKYSNAQ
jgi:hypothetical protein